MKFTSALCVIILAATASAVAVPNPEAAADPFCQGGKRIGCPFGKRSPAPEPVAEANPFCQGGKRIGCPFGKRMADARAEAEAAADANPFCQGGRRIGCPFGKREAEAFCHDEGPCKKNKRTAEAVAEAFALPHASPFCQGGKRIGCPFGKRDAEAEATCNLPGGPCEKARRAASAIAEAAAAAHPEPEVYHAALVMREAFPEPEAGSEVVKRMADARAEAEAEAEASPFCQGGRRIGCPFGKRSAEAEADALAFCNAEGGACAKVRRAAEAISEAVAEADPFCQGGRRIGCPFGKRSEEESKAEDFADLPGQANSIARRNAAALAAAAEHAVALLN